MTNYQIKNEKIAQVAQLNRDLFILEVDDYAYMHGKGAEIEALRAQIKQLYAEIEAL